jgi:hypothetical protein
MAKRVLGTPTYRVVLVDADGFAVGEELGISEWVLSTESQDKPAHLSVMAEKDRVHYVTSISAGLDQPITGHLMLRFGTRMKLSWFVHGSLHLPYPAPIVCAKDEPLELTLSSPDGLKKPVRLSVALCGYTR